MNAVMDDRSWGEKFRNVPSWQRTKKPVVVKNGVMKIRFALKMTQYELGIALGYTSGYQVGRWEREDNKIRRRSMLKLLEVAKQHGLEMTEEEFYAEGA